MRIAVVGAGVGGLAAAVLLCRQGHDVTVVDRFERPRPLGSGLVIQPVGLAVLDLIGIGDAARRLGAPIRRMQGHAGARRVLDVAYRDDAPGLGLHRAALFHLLWTAAGSAGLRLVTGQTVTGLRAEAGRMRLMAAAADGTAALLPDDGGGFDLVVDAAGAGSRLSPVTSRPLPFGAVWAHVPWPAEAGLPRDRLSQHYARADRMAGVLPIGGLPGDPTPRAAVFWSMSDAALAGWPDRALPDWQAEVVAFWPAMAPFLAGLTDKAQLTPARYRHGSLRRPHQGRVIHIGDAAHRASPQLGQGANMALLDAAALALALNGVQDGAGVDEALPRVTAMRRWHLAAYQGLSAAFTPLYQSRSRVLPVLRDHLLAPAAQIWPVRGILTALVSGDLLPPLAGTSFPAAGWAGTLRHPASAAPPEGAWPSPGAGVGFPPAQGDGR